MKYKKTKIDNYNLHMINIDNFKSITVDVIFSIPTSKEVITKSNFLFSILDFSSKKYSTRRELEIEKENLYSSEVDILNYKMGNYYNCNFSLSCLNDEYTEKGNFFKSLDLLKEIIFNPNIKNKSFDKDSFNTIMNNTITDIKGIYEDPAKYSLVSMIDNIGDDIYSLHEFGYLDEVEKITPESLYDFYKYFMDNTHVEVFVVGDIDFNSLEEYFSNNFKFNNKSLDDIYFIHKIENKEVKTINEDYPSIQGKLNIGFKMDNPSMYELDYVLPIYNLILGGNTEARLHNKVREEKGLCYYIYSNYDKKNEIFYISSGINKSNLDEVNSIVDREMSDICNNLTLEELDKVRNGYLEKLDRIYDSQVQIASLYYQHELFGSALIDERKEIIKKITVDEIKDFASKIHKEIIFLLGGEDSE